MIKLAIAATAFFVCSGCASIAYTEYYEPTPETAVIDADGYTRGAVKSELKQSGYNPAEKTFSMSLFGM